jgi:hypothetical protein
VFLAGITFCLFGEKWFPSQYLSYVEWVGIVTLISFFGLFIPFCKFVYNFLKNKYNKYMINKSNINNKKK